LAAILSVELVDLPVSQIMAKMEDEFGANDGWYSMQGDHLSGKPGNVREFGTCQGNVRDVVNSQGIIREKNLVIEKCPKTVHY